MSVGQRINMGTQIGAVGNTGDFTTGAHLHFDISDHDRNTPTTGTAEYVNPTLFFPNITFTFA